MEKNRTPILYRENDKFIYEGDLGMKTNERQTSAKKKLIPAVAMLTASAVMLTTATYAWFTMNKEVDVSGLKMTATASDALEISLGSVKGEDKTIGSLTEQPKDEATEISWTKSIDVGEYYDTVKYIAPASSVNGTSLFKEVSSTNAGMTATDFEKLSDALINASGANGINVRTNKTANDPLDNVSDVNEKAYYVDVPVHLRTSTYSESAKDNKIYCKMKITNADGTDTTDLYKAVRVAFIPTDASGNIAEATTAASIWGADDATYNGDKKAIASAGNRTTAAASVLGDPAVVTTLNATTGTDTGMTIPSATTHGAYGHTDFIVRVWLEGESTSCQDANALQDWNIDFAFAIDNTDATFQAWGNNA